MSIYAQIQILLNYGVAQQLLEPADVIYARHRLMVLLGLAAFHPPEALPEPPQLGPIQGVLDALFDDAVVRDLTASDAISHDLFDSALMDCLMPRPSEVQAKFKMLYQHAPQVATDYFYQQSRASNYVRTARIAQNITWHYPSRFGTLDVTINRSKPEIDPSAIAAARLVTSEAYPACLLCRENEGYSGRINHPARQNLRLIPLRLADEDWFLQYSPYEYYNEHCIVLKAEHEPMRVSAKTFKRLLDFVQFLPHYFVGSNADLPIVGGSILSHEHFQGGHYRFAMQDAAVWQSYDFAPNVELQLLDWPLSVMRLRSSKAGDLLHPASQVLDAWRNYSDEAQDIRAFTDTIPHNTITLIARQADGMFELDMILRNNRTDDTHPYGIFHPSEDLHHIKKENIGLIEVMGLAILPERLLPALQHMAQCLVEMQELSTVYSAHQKWFDGVRAGYSTELEPLAYLKQKVGEVFEQILCCAGVFKATAAGRAGFEHFVASLK